MLGTMWFLIYVECFMNLKHVTSLVEQGARDCVFFEFRCIFYEFEACYVPGGAGCSGFVFVFNFFEYLPSVMHVTSHEEQERRTCVCFE